MEKQLVGLTDVRENSAHENAKINIKSIILRCLLFFKWLLKICYIIMLLITAVPKAVSLHFFALCFPFLLLLASCVS